MGVEGIVGEGVNVGADVGVGDGVTVVPHPAKSRIIIIMRNSNIFLINIFLLILNPAACPACPAVFVGRSLRVHACR